MKSLTPLFGLALLIMTPALVQAKIVRVVEKTFAVQDGGSLKIQTSGGDINVVTGDGSEVKVTAKERISADSEAEADVLLKDLSLTIEQDGNNVTAIAKYEKRGGWFHGSNQVSVSFTVLVPRQYNVDLNTSGGNIALESLHGKARLRTSGGNLKLDRIDGEVDGRTSGGDISLREGTAAVSLSTSGGNISVDRAGGAADLSTSGGNVTIDSVRGRVRASTSGGNVKAKIEGSLSDDCDLSTSGGTVIVTVDKGAAFDLKAHTSGGNVDVEGVTIAIDKGGLRKSSLSGKVNGGGPELSLRSSGGDIRVRSR